MGKISNINKEKELIGLFLNSREAINVSIENNLLGEDIVDDFNKNVIECIFNKCRNDYDFIPTINYIIENINTKISKEKIRVKLNRYKKMIQREIINEIQYKDITIDNIKELKDCTIKRKIIHVLKNGLDNIDLPANEFISYCNTEMSKVELTDSNISEIHIYDGFIKIKKEMEYMLENNLEFGLKTYMRDVDEMIGDCIALGTYSVILGRPSNYKTGFALNAAYNMALHSIPTAIFSHEMDPVNCYRRIIARVANVEMKKIKNPKILTKDEWLKIEEAIEIVKKIPLYIIDGSKLNIASIDSTIAYLIAKYGIKIFWWDYLQLIRKRDNTIATEERDFAEISEEMRMFSKKYNIAAIALSQANRQCEARDDKRPTMKDIRNSGKIEQDAENIFYVYRDEFYYTSKSTVPNHLEIGALKVREGELRKALVHFNGAKATLSDCDPTLLVDLDRDYIGGGLFEV